MPTPSNLVFFRVFLHCYTLVSAGQLDLATPEQPLITPSAGMEELIHVRAIIHFPCCACCRWWPMPTAKRLDTADFPPDYRG